jgi:hypothetical protein
VEFEPKDRNEPEPQGEMGGESEFERDLKQAFERRPAPPRLKRKVLEAAQRQRETRLHRQTVWWQRIAAGVLVAAAVAGGVKWREDVVRRKGEQAREQVLTALRITGHALDAMNARLAEHDRDQQ